MGSKHSLSWALCMGVSLGMAACGDPSKSNTGDDCEPGTPSCDCSLPSELGERGDDYLRLLPTDDSRDVTLADSQRPGELGEFIQSRDGIAAGAFYRAVAGGIGYPHTVTYFSDDSFVAADLSKTAGSSLERLLTRPLATGFQQWELSGGEAISDYEQEDHGVWLYTLADSRHDPYWRGLRLGGGEPFQALPRVTTRRNDQGGIVGFIVDDEGRLAATDERFENRSPVDACGLGLPYRTTFVSDRVILLRQRDGHVVCRLDTVSLATNIVAAVDDGEFIENVTVAGNELYVATTGDDVVRVRRFALDHESTGELLLAEPGTFAGLGVSCGGLGVIESLAAGRLVLAYHKKNGERLTLELGELANVVRVEPTSELLFFNTSNAGDIASGYIDRSGAKTMWANTQFLDAGNRRYQLQAESYSTEESTSDIEPIRIYLVDLWTADRIDLGTIDSPGFGARQDVAVDPYETADSRLGRFRRLVDPLLAVTFVHHDAFLGLFQQYCLIDTLEPRMSCVRRAPTD